MRPGRARQARGKAACPAKSKAGTASRHAVVGPQRVPLNFNVNAYVGGNNLIIFYIEQIGGTVTKALQGKISSASGKFSRSSSSRSRRTCSSPLPACTPRSSISRRTLSLKKGKN